MPHPFLVFDAYGTLLELDNFYHHLQNGFAAQGIELPLDAVIRAAHREMYHYIAQAGRAVDESSWHALRRECAAILANAIREQGYWPTLDDAATLQILSEAIVFEPFAETAAVLKKLGARGVKMAVASNWDYQLPLVLAQHGLETYFEYTLTSAAAGCEKPAPKFFRIALDKALNAGGEPGHIYYIGDHYEKDVVASREAGFQPLWLVRDQRDIASGETHDTESLVTRLRTLTDLLKLF